MKIYKKLLILIGLISVAKEPSAFELMKDYSSKINTPQELIKSKKISKEQHELIVKEINSLKNMNEQEKKDFYKRMLKNRIFLTGPEQPCPEC